LILTEQKLTTEQLNFAIEFAKALQKFNPYVNNPLLANQYLKNLNMNPADQSKEKVKQMILDPKNNEQGLRRVSQYLYDSQMSYKRMNHYLADILTFDWYPVPINATEQDMKKSTFKKDFERTCEWFDKFNIKKEFKKAMLKMSLEDGYFTYLREDEDGDLFLQEMPIDFCLIDSYWKYGYLYSFNLMYFQQSGVDINGFAKEFKTYYNNALDMKKNKTYYPNIRAEMRNGQWMYWQQIKPKNGWVFKFHNHFAGLVPPFLGVFLDFIDIPSLKEIQNAKSELEAYKIIMGTVPRNKENKSNSKTDDFAISADSLANFVQLVKNSLQNKYVDFKAVPLENLNMFSFDDSANKEDVLLKSFNNISTQTGIDKALMNTDKPNQATMKMSKLIDAVFMSRLYEQFEDFVTYHSNINNKKFKFRIHIEGTIHDTDERLDKYLKIADKGMILAPQIASSIGMSIKDFNQSMALTKSMGFVEKLDILPTSYTRSKDDEKSNGRPQKQEDKLDDNGVVTRDAGSNIDKGVEK